MGSNIANNTTDVPPEADIGIVKEVNATECTKDQIVEWTITMTNYGPDGAENVIVKDNLPDTLIFISADGDYDPETGIWTIDYLANGEVRVLHIITKVNTSNEVIINNATVTSGTYDPNMENNKDSNSTKVKDIADLEVIKTANVDKVKVGDKIVWTITVINHGPDKATNVIVNDRVIAGEVTLISSEVSKGYADPSDRIWEVGDLEVGESAVWTIVDQALTAGDVINYVNVTSDTFDPNSSNDESSFLVEVSNDTNPVPVPDNNVEKVATPTMHATGNPIVMVLLALLAIVGVTLRRKH